MLRTVTTTAILALTLTAAQAGPVITVPYGDLDLSRPADAQVLGARVARAAESTCDSLANLRPALFYKSWFAACVRSTAAEATSQIAALSRSDRIQFASR
jgi:UrcA family protein